MRVTTSASPSQTTFATTSPHIDVVTTTVGTPSDSAASSSFPHPHATNASAASKRPVRNAILLELIMSPIPANLFLGKHKCQTEHSRGASAEWKNHGGCSPRAVHHRPAHCDHGGGIRPPLGDVRMLPVLVEMPVRPPGAVLSAYYCGDWVHVLPDRLFNKRVGFIGCKPLEYEHK